MISGKWRKVTNVAIVKWINGTKRSGAESEKKKYNRYTKDWKKRNRSRKNRVVKMR